ncbi:MAG: hypothetical protein ABIQ65_15760 [Thermoanaerobaculia bacterium]
MIDIRVVDIDGKELPGIPTARLIQNGGGMAYFVPPEEGDSPAAKGVWYLQAPGYESPTGEYQRVRIVREERPF